MAKGDLISYSNLCSMLDATKWRCFVAESFYGNIMLYAIAPSIYCTMSAHITGLFSSLDTGWSVQRYDPEVEGNWSTVKSFSLSVRQNERDKADYFYHNISRLGTTAGDVSDVHLWKFTGSVTWTQGSNWYAHLGLYCGGVERMTEDEFNSVCKFNKDGSLKHIKGLKPMIYAVSTASSDGDNISYRISEDEIIAEYTSNPLRGTEIGIASGTFKYCC